MRLLHRPVTRTDRLPAELMAQVLDNTKRADTKTLHACCFVCVAWHSYLIDSLYATIRLGNRSQLDRLARAVRIYPTVRGRLALARSVILEQDDMNGPGFAHAFPLVFGPHLHKVQDLTLRDCFWQPLHPSFFVKLRQFKDVKHLCLSGSPPQSPADFQRIVCAFPRLEELDIADLFVSTSKFTSPHVLNLSCISKLTCLRVSDIIPKLFHDLVACLSSSGVRSTIRRLNISLYSSSSQQPGSLNALLVHTASTLEHLRMFILMRVLGDHWGFLQFSHLRVLDITLEHRENHMSTKDVQRVFHNILASLTSPVLEHVHLELQLTFGMTLPAQDMDSRDTITDAYRAQYADLHAVLTHRIFSSLHRVTVVLCPRGLEKLVSTKDVALKHLDFLRTLFAPWCVRGIANLACAIHSNDWCWEVAVDKGKGPCYIDLRSQYYDLDTALQFVGLDPERRWPG